ncbi:MAG TPA: ABC transporter permease [Urbifossiella sp.]|nr:ABC transporter permease [Urbifossiella sp.]
MPIFTLAAKDLRLLLRDSRSAIILLLMPLVLVLVLGLALGESFGQTPDDRLRISIVNLDGGLPAYPNFPPKAWSEVVIDDLSATPDIRIESIAGRAEGERLVAQGKRPAVIVFDPEFSAAMDRCSFLTKADPPPLNPLGRDGVRLRVIGVTLLKDPTQPVAASVIEQVIQVTMLRVVVPWMIGRAFEYLGKLPLVGSSITRTLQEVFSNYNFTAKTWAGLTRSAAREGSDKNRETFTDSDGSGLLKRGAIRYQVLVPSYTVMFAFFLVLTVGWLFVAERKHNTLIRLRFAPLGRSQVLLGKLLPCLAVSLFQGFFLLIAGKLVFGMNWGADPWLLIPVVVCTSVAAVGLAMLVASVSGTETQVAVYGTLLVLVLGGVSGSLMPRDLMPESMKQASLVTPQAWALDAYAQLLVNPQPELSVVATSCAVLLGFGVVFLAIAWWAMRLD